MDKKTYLLKQIADAKWDIDYYNQKLVEADYKLELCYKELDQLEDE
jgi:hypothetical protein